MKSAVQKWFILGVTVYLMSGMIFATMNLNTATGEQLSALPLTSRQQDDILFYLQTRGYFDTIYDLLEIESIDPQTIQKLKPLISVEPPEISDFAAGMERSAYKLEQWMAAEGNSEGLSELWLDRFFDPMNINKMNYDDLMALPNISPVDAAAVLKQQKRGTIYGTFELQNAPGISYYGYRNLRDFVRFTDGQEAKPRFHARLTQLIRTVPVTTNPDDEGNISQFNDISRPEIFRRLALSWGRHLNAGHVFLKNMGNPRGIFTEKRYLSIENYNLGFARLDRLILGNFTATFGQGVVMETSDYFSPRRTGYGFSKRSDGIYPDNTRSSQYVMDGLAIQISNPIGRLAVFASYHSRDAIINADQSFSSLLVMQPRLPWGVDGTPPPVRPAHFASPADSLNFADELDTWQSTTKIYEPLTDAVNEATWGWNIRVAPLIGTYVGFTFYESLYDRVLDPQIINSITGGQDDLEPEFDPSTDYDDYSGDAFYLTYLTNTADPEIAAMYASSGTSPLWGRAKSFRRLIGVDFSSVISNMVFQGEYGEFISDHKFFHLGDEPHALVLSAFAQFNNFNFLALYRDYELGFDNPYQRSFSNYQRFKTTIFEDSFWLEDPVYSYLYSGNPQPQSEKGTFLSGRYQFHRDFVGTFNWDTWTRAADDARYFRTVATIDWRPAFNYRVNIRQKWQARGSMDVGHPSPFDSRETRIRIRLRMSGFDQAELLYSFGHTTFSPRPRLTDNGIVPGADVTVGNVNAPDETIGFSITHNFDKFMKISGGSLLIKGFLWNFEDTDFRIFNSESGALHHWIAFTNHPTPTLSVKFKFSYTHDQPFTRITEGQISTGQWISNPTVIHQSTDFRVQLDYAI